MLNKIFLQHKQKRQTTHLICCLPFFALICLRVFGVDDGIRTHGLQSHNLAR